MKKVLFFSCTVQGLKKLAPVIERLSQKQELALKTVIVGWREQEYCTQHGIPCRFVDDYSPLERKDDWDTELAIDAMYRLLSADRPDLLVTIDSGGFMESLFRFCRKKGIVTAVLQHAPLAHRLHGIPLEADRYLYWGDFFARQLQELLFVPQKKIAVTGSAQFDETLLLKTDRAEIASITGLDASKKWYVFCGQPGGNLKLDYAPEKAVEAAGRVLGHDPQAVLIYRPHPDQSEEETRSLQEKAPAMQVVRSVDTVSLIRESVGVMTYYSTVSIDAALLGKPLLLFNRADLKHSVLPLYDLQAALCCDQEHALEQSVLELTHTSIPEETRQTVIRELNGNSTGQAVERIVQECMEMLLNGGSRI